MGSPVGVGVEELDEVGIRVAHLILLGEGAIDRHLQEDTGIRTTPLDDEALRENDRAASEVGVLLVDNSAYEGLMMLECDRVSERGIVLDQAGKYTVIHENQVVLEETARHVQDLEWKNAEKPDLQGRAPQQTER